MFRPHVPGFFGHVFVNLLAQLGIKGRLIEPGQLLLQLHAKNFVSFTHKNSLPMVLLDYATGGDEGMFCAASKTNEDRRSRNEFLVGPQGFEPWTNGLCVHCSNR